MGIDFADSSRQTWFQMWTQMEESSGVNRTGELQGMEAFNFTKTRCK